MEDGKPNAAASSADGSPTGTASDTAGKPNNPQGQPTEGAIPKARFDEVIDERNALRAKVTQFEQALGFAQEDPQGFIRALHGDELADTMATPGASDEPTKPAKKPGAAPTTNPQYDRQLQALWGTLNGIAEEQMGARLCKRLEFVNWDDDRDAILKLRTDRRCDLEMACKALNSERMEAKYREALADKGKSVAFTERGSRGAPPTSPEADKALAELKANPTEDNIARVLLERRRLQREAAVR